MFRNEFRKTIFSHLTETSRKYGILINDHNGRVEVLVKQKYTIQVSLKNRKLKSRILIWDRNNKPTKFVQYPFFINGPRKEFQTKALVLNKISKKGYAIGIGGKVVFLKTNRNRKIGKYVNVRCCNQKYQLYQ